jgi:hypothetical protein
MLPPICTDLAAYGPCKRLHRINFIDPRLDGLLALGDDTHGVPGCGGPDVVGLMFCAGEPACLALS